MNQTSQQHIGIIGGGIMGISLGYFLTRRGLKVTIYEASPVLGGLAGPITLGDGTQVDRFYHAILSSDRFLSDLCKELGIDDQLRYKETKTSFYYNGKLHPMNNIIEFFKFPPLGWIDRFRLGLTVLAAQFVKDWKTLESVSVQSWLLKWSGETTFQNIWRPMLKAKFDGGFDNVPATWIWSRIKPHAPPLVRAPVNSFEFHACARTPQAVYLMRELRHGRGRYLPHLVYNVYGMDYRGI